MIIDVFLVGGGGGGPQITAPGGWSAGAGGGYTITEKNITLINNIEYQINIGAGGVGLAGGESSAFGYTANGGYPGSSGNKYPQNGGNGGSGGGQLGNEDSAYDGGSDGSDGGRLPLIFSPTGGKGQGTTTREFGDASITLYSGGGGAFKSSALYGKGGAGGGADGGNSAIDNTGGGAGGGLRANATIGGSGIVIIRNHRE